MLVACKRHPIQPPEGTLWLRYGSSTIFYKICCCSSISESVSVSNFREMKVLALLLAAAAAAASTTQSTSLVLPAHVPGPCSLTAQYPSDEEGCPVFGSSLEKCQRLMQVQPLTGHKLRAPAQLLIPSLCP